MSPGKAVVPTWGCGMWQHPEPPSTHSEDPAGLQSLVSLRRLDAGAVFFYSKGKLVWKLLLL